MNPLWRSALAATTARFDTDSGDLIDFGDASGELQAAANASVVVPLTHLALLDAQGDDATAFLHSQFTSDINHLSADQAQHAGWCSAKGRMQASFVVWHKPGGFALMLAEDLVEASHKRLQMFILRSKVKLSIDANTLLIGVSGPQAKSTLAAANLVAPEAAMSIAQEAGITVVRLDDQRFVIALPADNASVVLAKLSGLARLAAAPAWRWLDVRHAFPLVTLATKEEFVPQMADFEKIGGVSFHKGCYPGQEIVARTQYLGKVKRHLFRLQSSVPLAAGQALFSPDNPDQSCGTVMTAATAPNGGFEALAVVQSNFADNVRLGSLDGTPLQASAVNP